jgi:phosphoglycerate kinase
LSLGTYFPTFAPNCVFIKHQNSKSMKNLSFTGKKVLIRVDFNVPLDKKTFEVADDTRIREALPTIKHILSEGGAVILMSHFGRPLAKLNADGSINKQAFSLKNIIFTLEMLLRTKIRFAENCIGEPAMSAASELNAGEILLLENTRFHAEEEAGDENFAKQLADLGDIYINDAFGSAHRAHASTTTVAHYFDKDHKSFGFLMEKELLNAGKVLHHAERPLTAIIGGAKVSDKILLLEKLVDFADNVIIGGGMAYTFFKAQGGEVGTSLVEADKLDLAISLIEKAKAKGVNLILPPDSLTADAFNNDANRKLADNNSIDANWMGLDIGPKAIELFCNTIMASKTIFWNGPMGVFEFSNFATGTKTIAETVAKATKNNGAFSLVGGGDSVAAINSMELGDDVSYVSTGGGAMLEFMEGKRLPGVVAIEG